MDGVAFFSIIIILLVALLAIIYYFIYKHNINKKLRNRDYENDQAKPSKALSISQFLLAAGIVGLIIVFVMANSKIDKLNSTIKDFEDFTKVNIFNLSNRVAELNQKVADLNQNVADLNETLRQQDIPFSKVQVEYGKFDAATNCGDVIFHILPKENITPLGVVFEDKHYEGHTFGAEYVVTIPVNIFISHNTDFYFKYANINGNTAFQSLDLHVDLMRQFLPRFQCYISSKSDSKIGVFLNYTEADTVSIVESGFVVYVDGEKVTERQFTDKDHYDPKEIIIPVNSNYSELNVVFTCRDTNGFTYISSRGLRHDNLMLVFLTPWTIYNKDGAIIYDNYN